MHENQPQVSDRVATGVPGLDAILLGGLLRKSVYMVQGRPGGGKTILASQMAFHHAAQGGRVVYSTLLAETHERLLEYIGRLDFFDMARVPAQVSYVSAFATLQEAGLKGLAEMLRREARARKATLVVLDGLVTAEEHAQSNREFKQFIQELQIHAGLVGYTVLLLTSATGEPVRPEHTMVDGVICVSDNRVGRGAERELVIKKFRGSGYLRGGHAFQITSAGLQVYPRFEAVYQDPDLGDQCKSQRVSTGVATLDRALHGGLVCSSSTVMFGPTGAGKTSLGLHFLSESSAAEPGLLFGFYETPARLLMKAKSLGLDLEGKQQQGVLDIQWYAPTERILDALGHRLLDTVSRRGIKRLFVDGIEGFLKAAEPPERITHFLSALTNQLRIRGVTVLYTSEMNQLFSREAQLPIEGVSSLVENIFLLRFLERRAEVLRTMCIIKTRDSAYDRAVRAYEISSCGVALGDAVETGSDEGARTRSGAVQRLGRLLRRREQ